MIVRWWNRWLPVRRVMSLVLACTAWMPQAQAGEKDPTGWRMNVPNGYRQALEDGGQTLVLTPANPDQFLIRFTFHSLAPYVKERPRVGREFIEHLAAKKGLKTFEVAGNGGVAYLEPAAVSEVDGGRVQETAGGLGLDDAYVTFTLVVDEAALADPVVKELLQAGLPVLLGRVRSGTP